MRIVEILFYDQNKAKLVVEMPDPSRCTTDMVPHLPRSLFRLFPHLAHHKCHNDGGYSFRRESRSTEIPHLLEHLIIELQTQAQRHEILKGETQWNWRVDPRGTFHVHVEYENEQLVLAAIRLVARGGELVAGDAVLERRHRGAVVQAQLQVVPQEAPDQSRVEGIAGADAVHLPHLEGAALQVERAVVDRRPRRAERERHHPRL